MSRVEAAPSRVSIGRAEEPTYFGKTKLSSEQFTPFVKPPIGTSVQTVRTIKAGEITYIGDTHVSVQKPETLPKPAMDTVARAEGAHAFLAVKRGIGVRIATIQSGPGYLGMVEVERPDAIVAAGHRKGNSHDRRVIRSLGADEEASYRTAEGILRSDPDGYDAVTALLEEKHSANGHQILEAVDKAKERKETVLVIFRTPDGRVFKRKERATNGEVIIQEIQTKPKEKTIFEPKVKRTDLALAA